MKDATGDRLLIWLAVLGPLLLVLVARWQASLTTWYVPWSGDSATYFDAQFAAQVKALPGLGSAQASTFMVVADRDCPCTRVTLNVLKDALAKATRRDIRLQVMDVRDPLARTPEWSRVLRQIPATPTLLITQGKRLLYAGPVNSGQYCTSGVLQILGLTALEAAPPRPVINWLQQGCYCRMPRPAAAPGAARPVGPAGRH